MDEPRSLPRTVLLLFYRLTLAYSTYTAKWSGCLVEICRESTRPSVIACEKSAILIHNVTTYNNSLNEVMFRDVRRTCMGKSKCFTNQLCLRHWGSPFMVNFTCIKDSEIKKNCSKRRVETLRSRRNYIQNPNYPAASRVTACKWRILVPKNDFIILTLHEVETDSTPGRCMTGVSFKTDKMCSGLNFTSKLICSTSLGSPTQLVACGSVDLMLIPDSEKQGVRFWISYEVMSMAATRLSPFPQMAFSCAVGQPQNWIVQFDKVPSQPPVETTLEVMYLKPRQTTVSAAKSSPTSATVLPNTTTVQPTEVNTITPAVKDDKTALIGGLVTAGSLAFVLLLVLTICFRKKQVEKTKVVAKDASVQTPQRKPVESVCIADYTAAEQQHCPTIQESYSHVADEVTFPEAAKFRPEAIPLGYTEVDEGLIKRNYFNCPLPALPVKAPRDAVGKRKRTGSRSSDISEYDYQRDIYEEIPDHFLSSCPRVGATGEEPREQVSLPSSRSEQSPPDSGKAGRGRDLGLPASSCVKPHEQPSRAYLVSLSKEELQKLKSFSQLKGTEHSEFQPEDNDGLMLLDNEIYEAFYETAQ